MEKIYSVSDVAKRYGLQDATIYSFIRRGQLSARNFNGVYIITEEDLQIWEKTRKTKPWKLKTNQK